MTLAQLAEEADVSASYLSQLERGQKGTVSAEILLRLATSLGTSMRALMAEPEADLVGSSLVREVPEPLRCLYQTKGDLLGMTEDDVAMLAGIRYRDRQPRTEEDWEYLYLTIKRIVK